jgi:hypothetical protein
MATTTKEWTGVVRSDCACYYCEHCGVVYINADWRLRCDTCAGELTNTNCYGDCYDDLRSIFEEAFEEWREVTGTTDFAVYGKNIGWTSQSGHTGRMTEFEELMNCLIFDGDFILRWKLQDGHTALDIVRSSHDEMGALFTVVAWNEGDDE